MDSVGRFFQPPERSFFLFGPRGTGKSTWVTTAFPDALIVDLLQPETQRAFAARPERLRELVDASPGRTTVVVDEIQKAPALLDVVHGLIERTSVRFVLTGSSARKIRREGVDLLAGRALLRDLHPFMAAELGEAFDLESALRQGMVPLVVDSPDPEDVLRSYAALYVREEVQMEGLVRNVGSFSRFLEVASLSHASVLNLSNLARECEVGRKSVEGYLSVLEDLLLAYRLPVFSKRARRAVTTHPKLFFFDAGVFRSLRPAGPLDRPGEIDGAALEGLVAQHLAAWNAYRGSPNQLFFWRTRAGVEVDLVVYGRDGLWAFEVKNTDKIRPEDLRGLKAFGVDYPEARRIFLYRGKERMERSGIQCLPCEAFLRELRPERLPLGE